MRGIVRGSSTPEDDHRSRSSCVLRRGLSPPNEPEISRIVSRLIPNRLDHLGLLGDRLLSSRGEVSPRSKSSPVPMPEAVGMGSAEVEVIPSSGTPVSLASSRYGVSEILEDEEPCARERTTSPLQIGQVRRRVISHGVLHGSLAIQDPLVREVYEETHMHSTWNSWPHGRRITLLTPLIYSSKQTTHSTCLPR